LFSARFFCLVTLDSSRADGRAPSTGDQHHADIGQWRQALLKKFGRALDQIVADLNDTTSGISFRDYYNAICERDRAAQIRHDGLQAIYDELEEVRRRESSRVYRDPIEERRRRQRLGYNDCPPRELPSIEDRRQALMRKFGHSDGPQRGEPGYDRGRERSRSYGD
jgi:hypothetical protein